MILGAAGGEKGQEGKLLQWGGQGSVQLCREMLRVGFN